ncbi:Uma2 family endonuclease [Rhodocaloribacter litoris]|uniref:Uma2 family endonuclease n=1 Tax=Rhodocaloribacter litoris TaxID=2558931 RepID=UPI001420DB03|nr:Uma2 family endonuclease [Rhodocaloribacter litoris]QXD16963.1 Uma2 family endonuclease [Rhodocaloribacter litoris]
MITERPPVRFTYEDYLLIPEDGKRHELIDGEEHVAPAPSTRHQRIVVRLSAALFNHLEAHDLGEVFVAPIDVILSDYDVVQPDVLFVAKAHADRIGERGITGPPDLIVEVLSEGNRRHDEVRKRKLYERFGVGEYWVVDPELETVKVYRMTERGYVRVAEWSRENGDTLTTPLLTGFTLPLDALFA